MVGASEAELAAACAASVGVESERGCVVDVGCGFVAVCVPARDLRVSGEPGSGGPVVRIIVRPWVHGSIGRCIGSPPVVATVGIEPTTFGI